MTVEVGEVWSVLQDTSSTQVAPLAISLFPASV